MDVIVLTIGVALLLNNVHAVVAVLVALRWTDGARTRALARRCGYLTAGFAVIYVALGLTAFGLARPPLEMTPADQARAAGNAMAEGLYDAAFLLLATVVPTLTSVWLGRRARRLLAVP